MAEEVIDIIQRLSYQVTGTDAISNVITKFKEQADQIDRMKSKLVEYAKYEADGAAAEKYKADLIGKTTRAIDDKTAALQRQFNSNKQIQQALTEEMSLINSLNTVIKENSNLRFGVQIDEVNGVAKIKAYTDNIKAAQAELKSLLAPSNNFIAPVGAIQGLQNRQTLLTNAISAAPADPAYIASLNKQLDITKGKIKELQNAGKEPIINPIRDAGAIEALQSRITILKNTIKTVPAENIPIINQELAKTEAQLISLQGLGKAEESKGGGILAGLFGGGSTAKQLITGSLIGIGFGSGLGLITRAVSGLVEYAANELDATKKAEELAKANEALGSAFDKVSDAIQKEIDLQKILTDYEVKTTTGLEVTIAAYKNKEDAIKSAGLANKEAGAQEQKEFDAAQDRRELERQDLQKKYKQALYTEAVIQQARAAAGTALPEGIDGFDGEKGAKRSQSRAAQNVIDASLLPTKDKTDLSTALHKAFDDNANILNTLEEQYKQYFAKRIGIETDYDNKSAEILRMQYDRQRHLNEQLFELDEKMTREITANHEKAAITKIEADKNYSLNSLKDNEPSALNITDAAQIQRDAIEKENALETKQRQQELQDKYNDTQRSLDIPQGAKIPDYLDDNGKRHSPETDFANERKDIDVEQEQKKQSQLRLIQQQEIKDLREFIDNQIKETERKIEFSKAQDLNELNVFSGQSKNRADNSAPDYEMIVAAQDNAYIAEYAAAEDHYLKMNKLYSENGKDLKLLNEEYNEQTLQIDQKYYRERLDAAHQYFEKLSQDVLAEAELALTHAQSNIYSGGNGLYGKDNKLQRAGINSRISTDAKLEPLAQQVVNSDTTALDAAHQANPNKDDPNAAPTNDEVAANKQLVSDTQKLEDVKLDAAKASKESHDLDMQQKMQQIDAVQSLVDTTVKGYDVIADARQKDLQREIQVRTQRVDLAEKLAERGNTQALALEQNALNKSQEQQRQSALQQQEVNGALTVSNALVAVAKAAASGAGAIVLVPLVLSLLGTGFAEAHALAASQKQSFKDGVVGLHGPGTETSDSIPANLSRGESVITARATRKYGHILDAMNKDINPFPVMTPFAHVSSSGHGAESFASKKEMAEISYKLDSVVEAINAKTTHVSQKVDKAGVHQIVTEQQKAHRRKWA